MPSGGWSVNPATFGASGHSGLQQLQFSVSAQKRGSIGRLTSSEEVMKQPVWFVPAGHLLQGSELIAQEASLERLVSLIGEKMVHTLLYGPRLSSEGRSVNLANFGASGHSGLQRVVFSTAIRHVYGTIIFVPSSEVTRVDKLDTSCWSSISEHHIKLSSCNSILSPTDIPTTTGASWLSRLQ